MTAAPNNLLAGPERMVRVGLLAFCLLALVAMLAATWSGSVPVDADSSVDTIMVSQWLGGEPAMLTGMQTSLMGVFQGVAWRVILGLLVLLGLDLSQMVVVFSLGCWLAMTAAVLLGLRLKRPLAGLLTALLLFAVWAYWLEPSSPLNPAPQTPLSMLFLAAALVAIRRCSRLAAAAMGVMLGLLAQCHVVTLILLPFGLLGLILFPRARCRSLSLVFLLAVGLSIISLSPAAVLLSFQQWPELHVHANSVSQRAWPIALRLGLMVLFVALALFPRLRPKEFSREIFALALIGAVPMLVLTILFDYSARHFDTRYLLAFVGGCGFFVFAMLEQLLLICRRPRRKLYRWLPLGLGGFAVIAVVLVGAGFRYQSGQGIRSQLSYDDARRAYVGFADEIDALDPDNLHCLLRSPDYSDILYGLVTELPPQAMRPNGCAKSDRALNLLHIIEDAAWRIPETAGRFRSSSGSFVMWWQGPAQLDLNHFAVAIRDIDSSARATFVPLLRRNPLALEDGQPVEAVDFDRLPDYRRLYELSRPMRIVFRLPLAPGNGEPLFLYSLPGWGLSLSADDPGARLLSFAAGDPYPDWVYLHRLDPYCGPDGEAFPQPFLVESHVPLDGMTELLNAAF